METELVLKLENVTKSFARAEKNGVTNALDHINLEMHKGEFISVVGTSGCGKSTMLRLIAGLIQPTTGVLTLNGAKLGGPDPRLGMVFQQPTLFPWLTVERNIDFHFRMKGKITKEQTKEVERMLRVIGLEAFRKDYPGQLSGGMAQRVALARTLICQPEILLLDEPLGALDAFTRMNMQDEILSFWQESKQLVIMVTHDVEEAIYMGTRVVVMDSHPGRVHADIPIAQEYPRKRNSLLFSQYRNQILDMLDYGVKESNKNTKENDT